MSLENLKKHLNDNIHKVFNALNIEYEQFGDNIYSTCPIHGESDNPRALSYSVDRQMWKCWTRNCQEEYRNDILGLIHGVLSNQAGEEVEFKQVLSWCYKLLNITSDQKFEKSIDVDEEDDEFYNLVKVLKNSRVQVQSTSKNITLDCDIQYPSQYFLSRGFKQKTLDHFKIGDCNKTDSCISERAIVPIYDDNGKNLLAVIGRSIKEYRNPKFLFYPTGFDKRNYFYNYHRAIKKAKKTSCLFIVEGQGDVWKLYEAGVTNAVSIFGKTITKQQAQKLQQLPITTLVILTDNDQAGRESKVEIKRNLGRMYKLIFPSLKSKDVGEMSIVDIKKNILPTLKGLY